MSFLYSVVWLAMFGLISFGAQHFGQTFHLQQHTLQLIPPIPFPSDSIAQVSVSVAIKNEQTTGTADSLANPLVAGELRLRHADIPIHRIQPLLQVLNVNEKLGTSKQLLLGVEKDERSIPLRRII